VIDWDQVKVIGHESDRKTRWIKEAIGIRKCKDICMNRDSGSYLLSSSYDKLLLRDPAHFHRNDYTEKSQLSFLKKASADVKTSSF